MEILPISIFFGIFTSVICLISHKEPEYNTNLTSSKRHVATTVPKFPQYPQYIQAPTNYMRDFDELLSRSSISDSSQDTVRDDPNFIDLETHQKRLASLNLPQVTLYRLSPYTDPLSYYGGQESDSVSLKKHDFVRGNQGWNLGGWDNFQGGYNVGNHGHGGGGLKKGKEAKALFILMAPLILLAVFGPILATQAMLPWVANGGLTTVSTIAGGKRRRKRATAVDYRQAIELERRLQLFLEVQDFLARSGSPDLVEEMGEAFMRCQKDNERRNKCLERAACEYTDVTSDLDRNERRVGRMVLRNVMSNPVVPAPLIGRLNKGLTLAKNHPGRCSSYWCEALDGPKTKL